MWILYLSCNNRKNLEFKTSIRALFTPMQPTVRQTGAEVLYHEFLPSLNLQPYIYCYWELKTKHQLVAPFSYKVVADGCFDIFFELDNPQESFVMGFCKQYTSFDLENNFHYIGIRFLPTMFPQLFQISATELSNKSEPLINIIPAVAEFIEMRFNRSQNIQEIKLLLDDFFTLQVNNKPLNIDARLYNAIDIILKNFGVLNIEKDIDTGISARQLRRLFEFYIGDTPKTFSKVVRFQNILKAKPSSQSLKKNKLFFENGYYDQAHFIKDFKNFYGVTPAKAFGR